MRCPLGHFFLNSGRYPQIAWPSTSGVWWTSCPALPYAAVRGTTITNGILEKVEENNSTPPVEQKCISGEGRCHAANTHATLCRLIWRKIEAPANSQHDLPTTEVGHFVSGLLVSCSPSQAFSWHLTLTLWETPSSKCYRGQKEQDHEGEREGGSKGRPRREMRSSLRNSAATTLATTRFQWLRADPGHHLAPHGEF